jgi:hypothetical protein
MKNYLLHFDTVNNTNPSNNPYNNCNLKLLKSIESIKSIKLKSVELPLLLPTNIPASMTTLRYYITAADMCGREDFVSDSFPVGDYDILQLLSKLGEHYQNGNFHLVFSLNSSNKVCVEVVFASVFTFHFHFIQCPLLKMLGYSGNESFTRTQGYTDNNGNYCPDWSVMTMNFQNEYNLSLYTSNHHHHHHHYMNLCISNLPTPISFKIPLNHSSSSNPPVYFYQEENNFIQNIDLEDDNIVLDSLEVYLLDRFGNVFSGNHLNYSFTLEILTE